jgi:hypothetical protein
MAPTVIVLWLLGSAIGAWLVMPNGHGAFMYGAIAWVVCFFAALVHIVFVLSWRRKRLKTTGNSHRAV